MLPTRWAMLRFLSQPLLGTKKPPTQAWTVGSERRSGVRLRNDDDVARSDVGRDANGHTVFTRLHTRPGSQDGPCLSNEEPVPCLGWPSPTCHRRRTSV